MTKFLTLSLMLTFIASNVITFYLISIILSQQQSHIRQHSCDMSGIVYGVGIAIIFFMTLSSIAIYLNLFQKIRKIYFYPLLTFLFPPLLISVICILLFGDFSSGWKIYCAVIFPYLSILFFCFLRFYKKVKTHYN